MQTQKILFRILWAICLLGSASLACALVSDFSDNVRQIETTVQAVSTDIQTGKNILETGQAFITDVAGNELVQTAQAAATEHGPAIVATAQALITSEGPAAIATAQAFATDEGPALQATFEAFATQKGPGLVETAQAYITQASSEKPPEDIPIIENHSNLVTTGATISYSTPLSFEEVLQYYRDQMPNYGWAYREQGSISTEKTAVQVYEKAGKRAVAILNVDPTGGVLVLVMIQNQ